MSELTLQWAESGQLKTYRIIEGQPTLLADVFRIGRDPARCDLVLQDLSVSGLHVEILFRSELQQVFVRNLRAHNPPLVGDQQLILGDAPLRLGTRLILGRVELLVQSLRFSLPKASPPTLIPFNYGLKCPNPNCGKISAYSQEILQRGCPWCGFSLAAANSVVIAPSA